jgi:hypothetical protein
MICRCRQCQLPKPDNGWAICGDCLQRNIAYEAACAKQAYSIRQEFKRQAPGRPGMFLSLDYKRSETRGRKARNAVVASYTYEEDDE